MLLVLLLISLFIMVATKFHFVVIGFFGILNFSSILTIGRPVFNYELISEESGFLLKVRDKRFKVRWEEVTEVTLTHHFFVLIWNGRKLLIPRRLAQPNILFRHSLAKHKYESTFKVRRQVHWKLLYRTPPSI
jgi:hypothetical protein